MAQSNVIIDPGVTSQLNPLQHRARQLHHRFRSPPKQCLLKPLRRPPILHRFYYNPIQRRPHTDACACSLDKPSRFLTWTLRALQTVRIDNDRFHVSIEPETKIESFNVANAKIYSNGSAEMKPGLMMKVTGRSLHSDGFAFYEG